MNGRTQARGAMLSLYEPQMELGNSKHNVARPFSLMVPVDIINSQSTWRLEEI
jgi:hypothetical protein